MRQRRGPLLWLVGTAVAMFAAVGVRESLQGTDADPEATADDTRLEAWIAADRSSIPVRSVLAGARTPDSVTSGGLHQHLLTVSASHREQTLLMSLRDGGFACDDALDTYLLGDSWHVDCGSGLVYRIVIGELDRVRIRPIPHGDFRPGILFEE